MPQLGRIFTTRYTRSTRIGAGGAKPPDPSPLRRQVSRVGPTGTGDVEADREAVWEERTGGPVGLGHVQRPKSDSCGADLSEGYAGGKDDLFDSSGG